MIRFEMIIYSIKTSREIGTDIEGSIVQQCISSQGKEYGRKHIIITKKVRFKELIPEHA